MRTVPQWVGVPRWFERTDPDGTSVERPAFRRPGGIAVHGFADRESIVHGGQSRMPVASGSAERGRWRLADRFANPAYALLLVTGLSMVGSATST